MNVKITEGTIEELISIDLLVPEFEQKHTIEKLRERLADKANLILVARENGRPIAYKLGYEISSNEFYSWLGGVLPQYRKQGIATKLREAQENWAVENGYKRISVKSMNQFPAMLQLLIGSGYQITGYEDNGSPDNSKIKFSKRLIS